MMPTRPRNIAAQSSIFDASERRGVAPSDDPTVKSAEHDSNSSDRVDSCGSSPSNSSEKMR